MSPPDVAVVLKRFERPDELRKFPKGEFAIAQIGGLTIGRAEYQPGWRWSVDVGPIAGTPLCTVGHVGLVVPGHAVVEMADGAIHDLAAGVLFSIPAEPHDSWVVGNAPYVSLHFMGADTYAASHSE